MSRCASISLKKNLTLLITAGPTIEDIDPVRFLSNRATGRLGVELVRAALATDVSVIFVHGPLRDDVARTLKSLLRSQSKKLTVVPVRSAAQMYTAVMKHVKNAQALIMNAAVADFTPDKVSTCKLKKVQSGRILKLKPTVDILNALGEEKRKKFPHLILCGFALETGSGRTAKERAASRLKEARRKLEKKNLDLIVLDTPDAMGVDRSDFTVIDALDEVVLRNCTKRNLAKIVLECIKTEAFSRIRRIV